MFILYGCNLQFEEEAKLIARYEVPGRPTCLTVVGRRTISKEPEPPAEAAERTLETRKPLKTKKNKDKGKADCRLAKTSGSFTARTPSRRRI